MGLILYHFEVLTWATQPPSMSSKLHLEVVEPEFIFCHHFNAFVRDSLMKGDTLVFLSKFTNHKLPKRASNLKDEIRYSTSSFCIFSRTPKTRYPEVMSFVGCLEPIRKYLQTAAQIATFC